MKHLLLFLLLGVPCFGAVSIVQDTRCSVTTNLTSYTCAYGSNVTLGNLLIAEEIQTGGTVVTLSTPTAPCATFSLQSGVTQLTNGGRAVDTLWWLGYVTSGGACTVTFTNTHTGTIVTAAHGLYEVTGIPASSPIDAICSGSSSTATTATKCSSTMTLTGTDLVIAFSSSSSGVVWTATSPLTADLGLGQATSTCTSASATCNGISESGQASSSIQPAMTPASGSFWNVMGLAIKPSGGGGGSTVPPTQMLTGVGV